MIKYFKRAFVITNQNIILTTPLVLFLILFSVYLGFAKNAPTNIQSSLLLLVTVCFMFSAFFAGWFFMIKKAVELDKTEFILDEEKAKASFGLIKQIPVGIGEYFFSFIGFSILYVLFLAIFIFVAYKLGLHFIGELGFNPIQLKAAFATPESLKLYMSSLSPQEIVRFNAWNILILVTISVFSFLTMFWSVQIVSGMKNPLIAFFKSLSSLFKHPLSSIFLFLYISFINFLVSLINTFSVINPILYFVSMLIYFYFVVYVVVLIFLYYDREITDKTEDNSNSGTDSIRQEQLGDSTGKED